MSSTRVVHLLLAAVLFVGLWAPAASAQLKEYVAKEDPSFKFELAGTDKLGEVTAYHLRLTSQTWQGITWQHWLTVLRPDNVKYTDKALLFITGGHNDDGQPKFDKDRDRAIVDMAQKSQAVIAVLRQVPNEPLFNGLVEDEIIAYTFDQFLSGKGDDWPLLLPMAKSAVKAMDAVQQFAKSQFQQDIQKFVVTGASKRGWTTWLTAATGDPRVVAIAPMVIDVLNMPAQMQRQMKSYGAYSEQIEDYSKRGIQAKNSTPEGQKLNSIVDPYSYRESITIPKLLLLGTNDEYWTVDAANVYLKDLQGKTYVHYEPNAGHGLGPGAYTALLAFFQAVLAGRDMPEFTIDMTPQGNIHVKYTGDAPQINIWLARSITRDFRKAQWQKTDMSAAQRVLSGAGFSELGYAAFFVEMVYTNEEGTTYSLSGPMTVIPNEVFPFDENGTRIARGGPKGEPEGNPWAPKVDADMRKEAATGVKK